MPNLLIRPAENIFGQNAQTPNLTLGQTDSAYQFLADIIDSRFGPRSPLEFEAFFKKINAHSTAHP